MSLEPLTPASLLRRMASSDGRSWPRAIGISLMLIAVALAARFVVVAFIHQPSTYLTYYPVVVAAAIWAGWRGAAISLALSMALVFGLVGVEAPGADWIDLSIRSAIFLAGAGFIAWTGVILRETLRKLRAVMSQEREEHAALQTNEQRMRLAQDVAGFGVFDWNIETGEAYLSEGFLKNWGVTREVATDREVLLQRVHPDDRAMVRASNDAALASGRVYEAEYRIIRDSDGAERWLYVRGEVQLGPDGKARRTIGVNQDVTERKRAEATLRESEAALRESEERFRAMADSAPAPIWVTGPEGGIEFVNKAMLDFFAAERGALVGDGWRDRIHPDDLQPMLDGRVEARSRHLAYDFEARFRNATGQWRWIRAYSQPRFGADGAFVGYVGIAFDITEIHASQAALSAQARRERFLLELGDEVGALATPAEVLTAVVDRLGQELGADKAFYAELSEDEQFAHVVHRWARDGQALPDVGPIHELGAFGLDVAGAFRSRKPIRLDDISREHRLDTSALKALGIGALLVAPLVRDGRLVAGLGLTQAEPRAWTEDEVELVAETAARVWSALDRARAQAALAESEQRFRLIADSVPINLWMGDPEGRCLYLNSAQRETWGIAPDADLSEFSWESTLHPDDAPALFEPFGKAMAARAPFTVEARYRNAAGDWRLLQTIAQPRFGADGEFLGMIGANLDITEERAAQAAIEASRQQLRAMFDQAAAGMVRTDIDGRIEMINERFARMLGAEPDALVGSAVKEITWPDDQAESEERFTQLRTARRPYAVVKRYRRRDGSAVWASASVSPMIDSAGDVTGAVAVIIDLTETRKAEAALRESEQRFRLIADSAPVPMWVSRPGGAREFVNKAYVDYLEVSYDEALAEDWRDLVHPDDGPRIRAEQIAGEASHKPFTLEARYRRADGEWRWLRSFSQPRFGPDGEHIGFIGVAFDVTEAKQAAQDLQHINDLLAERVDAALEQKAQAEAALAHAQKIEAVGRLTGGVAHDFNNLLTVVIGALDMILKHPGDEKKRERMAEAAMAAARRGERLTHQLLAFSRRQALRPEVIDVNHLVRETEPLLRRAIGEEVAFDVSAAKAAVVRVDPGQFEATLLNLVVNARDATPAGGTIAVESAVRDIKDGSAFEAPPGRYVAVSVRDTGSGMPPEVAARAFEPFFTTKPVGKGTGLGLSQVYGFARQSGGGVTIESRPGEGTTITVFLPVAEAGADAQPKPAPSSRRAGASLRVLLVEDDPAVGAIAETMLGDLGHTIERADSAAPALERLNSDAPFDLLLTDVIMPGGVNGVELAREAVKLRPGLQVLLTSGYAGDAIDEALSAAPWPFLKKPYAEAELAAVLQGMRRGAEVG
ncbi:MAG: PAS domain S-box protein [Proteobacteria bacterium]|nr:PAS domain S-box protein [Pseudomonadota bacterium]